MSNGTLNILNYQVTHPPLFGQLYVIVFGDGGDNDDDDGGDDDH